MLRDRAGSRERFAGAAGGVIYDTANTSTRVRDVVDRWIRMLDP
jgi:hypothetical protein